MAYANRIASPATTILCNESTTAEKKHCIICSEVALTNINRDENYSRILGIYWAGIGADVKPDLNKDLYLCLTCYENLLELNEINDVLMYYENSLKLKQRTVLVRNMQGIIGWQEKGLKSFQFQGEILSHWGINLERGESEEAIKKILSQYQVTKVVKPANAGAINVEATGVANGETANKPRSSPRKRGPPKGRGAGRGNKRARGKQEDSDVSYEDEDLFVPAVGTSTKTLRSKRVASKKANHASLYVSEGEDE